MSLKGKVAIVSGGGRGIGKAISKTLAAEGAAVVLFSRTEEELKKVAAEIEAADGGGAVHYEVADATKPEDVERVVAVAKDKFGSLDIFVANAGAFPYARLEDVTLEDWNRDIALNLTSAFLAIKYSLPIMKEGKRGGRFVVISSISGPKTALPGYTPYCAAKSGLMGLVKTAAVELAKHEITVNAVLPGNIYTEALASQPHSYIEETTKAIPAGRLGDVNDIAGAVLYFINAGPFVTGTELVIDGAQTLPESHFQDY